MDTTLDAIVLAGDRGAARPVGDRNKALLPLGGKPLLLHVLEALAGVARIGHIAVVGSREELQPLLQSPTAPRNLHLLEQRDTVYQNFWMAFEHLADAADRDPRDPDRAVLLLAADTPLISAAEIGQFLDRCDLDALDYCVGMTAGEHLAKFYPTAEAPGIRMPYLHLADASLRINNLHLVKPLRVANRAYVQDIYEFRYQQRNPANILRAARDLLRQPGIGWRALYLYLMLQLAAKASALGWEGGRRFFSRRVTREDVTTIACRVLQSRVGIVETTYGGCAIDVDNARDYATLQERWETFRRLLPLD